MRKFLIAVAPVAVLASTPCVKDAVLSQDPLLPAPAIYVGSWSECQTKCHEGPLCHTFSFKEDSVPTGACWLFPAAAQLKEVSDPKAFSGPKACAAAPVPAVGPDAVPPAEGKAALRGYGIPAAAAHSYGVANAGHQVPGSVFKDSESGKTLVATPSSSDASNLAIAGGIGVAVVAAGAFLMLPGGKKKKTKRGLQRQEEAEEVLASSRSSAPLMEPPQVMYPTYGQVTYMQQVPQGVQMLQPMSYAVSQGGEYTVTEPVTAMASYVYDQSVPMAYQPVAAQ